jgi:uncharacterized protein YecE (DUF72 family)
VIRIGTAGWSIPKVHGSFFPAEGSHLERWAASVPEDFRFAVKIPKAITHEGSLRDTTDRLEQFLMEVGGLGPKLGPLLVQLPPSLRFETGVADRFLIELRARFTGGIACEPRHASWFEPEVDALLNDLRIARVAADPAPVPAAGDPGGWRGLSYYRLHGSPRIYYSPYDAEQRAEIARKLAHDAAAGVEAWCIFDNTAAFAAAGDAIATKNLVLASDR